MHAQIISKPQTRANSNEQTLVGHMGHVCGLSTQPNDRSVLWTGADDGLIKRWDIDSGACLLTLETPIVEQQGGSVWCVQVCICVFVWYAVCV